MQILLQIDNQYLINILSSDFIAFTCYVIDGNVFESKQSPFF